MKYTGVIAPRPAGEGDHGPEADDLADKVAAAPFGHAVGFLLSQLGYVVARSFRAVMAEVELEPRHFALLRAIEAADGQTQNFLVDLLRIPASSMVSLLDHLEQRGLVERQVHPSDRRSRTVHLTSAGHSLVARATAMASSLEATICRGLSGAEREEMIERLKLVGRNLEVVEGVHPDVGLGRTPKWTDSEKGHIT